MKFNIIIVFLLSLFVSALAQEADARQQTVTKIKVTKVEHGHALQQRDVCELQELLADVTQ